MSAFSTPSWKVGHFSGRRERAVEFVLSKDGYAKCVEEEEADRGVGESEEKSTTWLAVSLSLQQWRSLSYYQGKKRVFSIHHSAAGPLSQSSWDSVSENLPQLS